MTREVIKGKDNTNNFKEKNANELKYILINSTLLVREGKIMWWVAKIL